MRVRFLGVLLLALVGCTPIQPGPGPGPQPPPIPTPVPPGPTPTPTPDPVDPTPQPDETTHAGWLKVTKGMPQADVLAALGASKHVAKVGPGDLVWGYYVTFPAPAEGTKDPTKGSHYCEVVFDSAGKVASLNVW